MILRSKVRDNLINVSVDINETGIVLSPQDGLEDNQKYLYRLSAVNSVGITTTDENILCKQAICNMSVNKCINL